MAEESRLLCFPAGFLWGAATSAHQVEGNCTNNHWWAWEEEGGHISDGSVSGMACDHYHRFDEDFRMAAALGHKAQRISIEWSRIESAEGRWDGAAIDHYKAVCDSIRRHGMTPNVTLHHFTHPIWVQAQGGWENPQIGDWLARYAGMVTRELGGRVDLWWTINEPMVAPTVGYLLGVHPPCVRDLGRALAVSRHVLLAHAKMYHAIHAAVRHHVQVGVVKQMPYFEPFDPASEADRTEAAARDHFVNAYYLDSIARGVVLPPAGDGEEVSGLRESWDVIGLNYYMRVLVRSRGTLADLLALRRPDEPDEYQDEMGWEVHPPGLRHQLMRLCRYGRPLYVTENGMATLDHGQRARHLVAHLREVHAAIAAGADVRGYMYWSLMDNFEWAEGYSRHFGLVAVDRPGLRRRPRPAAHLYREIIAAGGLTSAHLASAILPRHGS